MGHEGPGLLGTILTDPEWLEPLEGRRPSGFQHLDPSAQFAALDMPAPDREVRAAVWAVNTGKVAWAPEGAQAIRWDATGREVVVAGADARYIAGWLKRYTWPERKLIGGGRIELLGYMFEDVAISPARPLVAASAIDQTDIYVGLYHLLGAETPPTPIARWEEHETSLINGLEFDPTGSALVWTRGGEYGWWSRKGPQSPSEGGHFEFGSIFLWEIVGGVPQDVRSIKVSVELPTGWLPEDPEEVALAQFMYGPQFEDAHAFRILLPTGEWRHYDLDLREIESARSGERTRVSDIANVNLRPPR